MEDLAKKVAFLEARLTLLERRIAHAGIGVEPPPEPEIDVGTDPIRIACSEPGLMIDRMYPMELDEAGDEFCWIGNEGPIQFVLPVRPVRPGTCQLNLKPHPKVNLYDMSVVVNDGNQAKCAFKPVNGMTEVSFDVPRSLAPNINVLLFGVKSVRPVDFGENADDRLLAARFFGAQVAFA